MTTFYCTKFATTKGILKFDGETCETFGTLHCSSQGPGSGHLWLRPSEYYETLEAAQQDALERCAKDIDRKRRAYEKSERKYHSYKEKGAPVRGFTNEKGVEK